jgi:prolyl-tRNA editing enzyme YbaK/EbsC (Cys-tRNA(Pro) deacylase)
MNVKEHLAERGISYDVIHHPAQERAVDVAVVVQAPPHVVAKTVLLKADGGFCYVAAVVPSHCVVDLEKASQALGGSKIELASPEEATIQCPDCEGGVVSPFGSQYNLKTLIDDNLAQEEFVLFLGNTRDETFRVRLQDYLDVENPLVVSLTSNR